MKYNITMTKTEIKDLCNSFTALSKTVLNNVIRDIDESYAEILKSGLSFGDYVDKLTTSGGVSNKDFTMEYIVSKDTVTVNVEMSIKLLLKVLSFYNKYLADILPYIIAFCKKHEDEMLDEIVAKAIEAIDAASDKEAEMHRFGSAVACTLSDIDADTALYLTKQIFGRIIDHYEEQEKMSKEEELERKYHKKNTEE